jgi:hypothetical protein
VSWPLRRLLLVGLGLAAFVAAYLVLSKAPPQDDGPTSEAGDVQTLPVIDQSPAPAREPVAEKLTSLEDLGAPDDPLPEPTPVLPTGDLAQSDPGANTLARQLLEGGPDFLTAVVTALQSSGIGTLGPDNTEVTRPAAPWQGIVMQRWEVKTTASMMLPERSVTLSLPDLAAFLVAVMPQLKGAPVETLILDDVRALAHSQVPTTRFLGQFIVALGRNATSHEPYDLLGDVSPQTIRLDGLQTSLILRRLAADIIWRANGTARTKSASFINRVGDWLAPAILAQGAPCSYATSGATDAAATAGSLVWGGVEVGELGARGVMERAGLERLGGAANVAATLLGYAQFIAAYAALKADVSMDAPRLERTKKALSRGGNRQQLTAIVKFDVGNAQMLNCMRGLLIAVGLDFSLPNNGPIQGAVVSWEAVEGFDRPEAIVRFVSEGSGPIRNAVTGEDGTVRVGVEGVPQAHDLSNDAQAVNKSAKVRLQVALKGADLVGDLTEAASTAAGGLAGLATVPISMLMRAQWASVGHFRFPVTDWREGPAEWTGTVKYTKVTAWSGSPSSSVTQDTHTETWTLDVEITGTVEGSNTFGNNGAQMSAQARANYTKNAVRTSSQAVYCNRVPGEFKTSRIETGEGSGTGSARVSLGISGDGQYSISVHSDVTTSVKTTSTTQQSAPDGTRKCQITTRSSSHEDTGSQRVGDDVIQGDGRIDPAMPDHLTGMTKETEGPTTRTLTWDLQRR